MRDSLASKDETILRIARMLLAKSATEVARLEAAEAEPVFKDRVLDDETEARIEEQRREQELMKALRQETDSHGDDGEAGWKRWGELPSSLPAGYAEAKGLDE